MSRSEAAAGLGGLPEFPVHWCIQNRRKGNIGGGAWQGGEGKESIGSPELINSNLCISVWKHWWVTYANMCFLFNTFSPVGLKLYCLLWVISQSQHKIWFSAQRTVTFVWTRIPQWVAESGRAFLPWFKPFHCFLWNFSKSTCLCRNFSNRLRSVPYYFLDSL